MDISQDTKLIPLTQGKFAIVDAEDYEHLMQWKWHCNGNGYVVRRVEGRVLLMHRVIIGADEGLCVDHISGIRNDNRKSNLRLATKAQNRINSKVSANNTSGYKGVYWKESRKKWVAQIGMPPVNGIRQTIHLGCFNDKVCAARAYDKAVLKYHGEYAKTNEMLGLLNKETFE